MGASPPLAAPEALAAPADATRVAEPRHLLFLDYLRGVAILAVLSYHSLGYSIGWNPLPFAGWFRVWHFDKSFLTVFPAAFGWAGVPLFFAISGFCIHLSHQRSSEKTFRVFFLRRFFRIYPPYLITLLVFAFLLPSTRLHFNLGHHDPAAFSASTKQILTHLFLVHNFFSTDVFTGINGALWSIAIEVQLYCIYPVLLWLASQFGWPRALAITALIELSSRTIISLLTFANPAWHFDDFKPALPFAYWFSWAIGAVLAEAYLKKTALPFRSKLGFAFPLLFIGSYFFKPLAAFDFTLAALTSVYAMSYFLSRPALPLATKSRTLLAAEPLRQAGVVSYSAYLIHWPILGLVPNLVHTLLPHHDIPRLAMYGFCLAAWFPIFGLAYLSYRFIELPSIAWGKNIIHSSPPRRPLQPRRTPLPSSISPQKQTEPSQKSVGFEVAVDLRATGSPTTAFKM